MKYIVRIFLPLVLSSASFVVIVAGAAEDDVVIGERPAIEVHLELRADAYLSTQPTGAEREKGQLRDIRADGGGKSLTRQRGVGSSGRIRTYNPPVNSRMLYP